MTVVDRILSFAALALAALSVYVAHAELVTAGDGAFMLSPSATVFWGVYFGLAVAVLGHVWVDPEPAQVALLATVQMVLAHELLYGGAVTFWEYGAESTYLPTLAAAVAAAVPAVLRLHKAEWTQVAGVLGGVSVVLGAALCYVALSRGAPQASDPALAVVAAVACASAGFASCFAAFTAKPRALQCNKAGWVLACALAFATAVAEGKKASGLSRPAMVSIAASLATLNGVGGAAVAVALKPLSLEALASVTTEAPASPPRTRFAALMREAESAALVRDEEASLKEG